MLIPLLAPRWYERRGTWVCLLARMAWLLNPNQRSARGIAHVLQVGKHSGGGMQCGMQAAAAGSLQLQTLQPLHVVSAAAGQHLLESRSSPSKHAHAQAPPATGQLGLAKDALRLFLGALPALECTPPCFCTCVRHMGCWLLLTAADCRVPD